MAVNAPTDVLEKGPLGRATATVYRVLILELLFLIAASPGLLLLFTLAPDPSNIPLAAAALLPVGPALSAVVFAWSRSAGEESLQPGKHFWRGYRLNALGVLRWWWLVLAAGAVLGLNLAYLDAATPAGPARLLIGGGQVAVLLALAVVVMHALIVTSFYTFRTIDVFRLAFRYLRRSPRASIGAAALSIASAAVVAVGTEAILLGLGSLIAALILSNGQPLILDIQENYLA